ncbi:MAG: hypothetical protein U9R02_06905 [Thermodesulfobacteriota bacterium]|nr:hypothetical protein [Thermodesulfobacteriota bacterium]
MRKYIMLFFIVSVLVWTEGSSQAKTIINLVDVSGSLSKCDTAFRKNLLIINNLVDTLGKKDRFIIYSYRSHGKPFKVVDFIFPSRRGGKNRNIVAARQELRIKIKKGMGKALAKDRLKMGGGGTDCRGALNYTLMIISDMKNITPPVQINHFSDGIQTTSIGSFKPKFYAGYLKLLIQKLNESFLGKPNRVNEIVWYGGICYGPLELNLSQSARLQAQLRQTWCNFLKRELPSTRISYLLNY